MENNVNVSNDENAITANVGGNFVLCPPGNSVGYCFAMIVMGTLSESFQGKPAKEVEKIMLGFEITTKKHVFKEEKGEEPFIIWVEHLLSLNMKANLRKMIHSWAGTTYTDEDMKEFHINDLIGTPALLNVISDTNTKGEKRSKISNVTAVPDGTPLPEMINAPLLFKYKTPFDQATFDRIPAWIQNKMKESKEYKQALGGGLVNNAPVANTANAGTTAEPAKKKFPFGNKQL